MYSENENQLELEIHLYLLLLCHIGGTHTRFVAFVVVDYYDNSLTCNLLSSNAHTSSRLFVLLLSLTLSLCLNQKFIEIRDSVKIVRCVRREFVLCLSHI